MSSSAAFATPPAPGGDNFGLRPLDAIAATSQGGVPQSRVHRILTDLEAPLAALHEHGSMHGALSPATIGLDSNGKAHLMPRPGIATDAATRAGGVAGYGASGAAPLEADASEEFDLPQAGYAAFEQYADDALLPRGPWTDIYGLSAVACQLITGAPPPDAEARRDQDDYVPLARRMPEGYDAAFLSAIDAGLALAAARRPNSMAAYLASFGSLEPAPAMPALAEPEVVVVQDDYRPEEADGADRANGAGMAYGADRGDYDDDDDLADGAARRRVSFWGLFLVLLLAVLAVPAWLWYQSGKDANAGRGRTPTGASFVPLTQRDTRAAQPGGAAADAGSGAQRGTVTGPGTSTGTGTGTGAGVGGDAGMPSSGPGASTATSTAPNGYAAGTSTETRPAGPQSSRDPGAASDAGAAGPTAAGTAPPAVGQTGADAGSSTGSSGRAATAPQPYHSTVTLGGGAGHAATPATPGAATEGQSAGGSTAPVTPAAPAAGTDTEAGQGAQAPAAEAAKPAKPPAGPPVLVRIDVRPWGEIVVDGVSRGVSPPLKELRLTPGKHAVIIKNTGLPNYRLTLEVKAGTPAVISHVFN
ncbi:hypothetical protein [Bordetella sp. N]|uniref:hypothetical protein n=1 Tax=Bordetella sp. N TaxID=1746199 RepID=UPI000710780B|nr:hypothetical protein [Bordetella sp. N]ALM85390.1 hypothetical protein ASB57_22610 [Bordetella sp. N]